MNSQSASGTRTAKRRNNNNNSDEIIGELTRRLERKTKKIAKLERNGNESEKQRLLQFAHFTEKLKSKNNKVVTMKIENKNLRKKIAEQNAKIGDLEEKISQMSIALSHVRQNGYSTGRTETRSVSHRIQEVIDEMEHSHTLPPSVRISIVMLWLTFSVRLTPFNLFDLNFRITKSRQLC